MMLYGGPTKPEEGLVGRSTMKRIRYLSVEEAEWSHNRILEVTGGERGDLARANLEFVLERVKDVGEGLETKKAIVKKAAFLLYSLVVHHPFINGNKRTAFEVVDAFLELNGYVLQTKTDDVYVILSDLGAGKASQTQVEDWIATNLAERRRRSRRRS
jgi:death-on-curing protein